MVGVTGFEPTASWSRTKRATNCATPRKEKPQQLGCCGVVGDERIELLRAESESAALPLCESPSGLCLGRLPSTLIYYSVPDGICQRFFLKNFNFFSKIFSFPEFIAAASIVFCYPVQVDQLNSRRHFYSLGNTA